MGIVAATKVVVGISDKNQTIVKTTIDTTNSYDKGDFYITEAATNIQKVSEEWMNKDLREFEDIGKRFLIWNNNARRKHIKLQSLLDDEDFAEGCKAWIWQQKLKIYSSRNLKAYIEDTLFLKLTGYIKKDTISKKTC
ncbi:4601_t:CDS:2 [Acaulospora morrowiae]|uniref:4601_t:CDS:1 n=1 Tax=Acaulospora morrowiae TaxID=94023 RepID=A0A9N9GFI8_9GLOM|nr:4601_t:CDS:2 [Acaulospora morrowiae]